MKKLLLVAMMAFGLTANAQERESGDIELIPYIGYSQSFFNGDNSNLYENKTSFAFGARGDYYFNDRWSLRSGLQYDNMGASVKANGFDLNVTYLTIPVNANWHFGSTRKWNLNFGLSSSFLLDAEGQNGMSFKEEVKGFQLGFSYGIGYKLEISDNFSLMFDAQGNVGITNINDISSSNVKQMNAISSFNIGGVFKL
ncbi:porin family protein [Tenacibaculum aiptasiae]|uniref:porin family protein n=1 Tax=Tenacibaculum aiptasiae TaxID=426481 RepID=UPI00233110C0|nr:porin family protein [Tenacibaculum aiptasiae]